MPKISATRQTITISCTVSVKLVVRAAMTVSCLVFLGTFHKAVQLFDGDERQTSLDDVPLLLQMVGGSQQEHILPDWSRADADVTSGAIHLFHSFLDMSILDYVLSRRDDFVLVNENTTQWRLHISMANSDEAVDDVEEVCAKWGDTRCRVYRLPDTDGSDWPAIQQLFDFCQQHPSEQVAFIGRSHDASQDRELSLEQVLSGRCDLFSTLNCNVCGAAFRPLQHPAFLGNSWLASCKYVRRLRSPAAFRNVSSSFAQQLRHKTDRIFFNMMDPTNKNLGTKKYAVHHWIASHPYFRPCDVAFQQHERWVPAALAAAPRYAIDHANGAYYFADDPNQALAILDDEPFRRREYFLLPGILHKMHRVYGAIPDYKSWMWNWYPDGAFWKQKSRKGLRMYLDRPFDDTTVAMPNRTYSLNANSRSALAVDKSRFVIFYHIYIPLHRGEEGVQNSLRIVNEQLDQIRDSVVAASHYPQIDILYATVGDDSLSEDQMNRMCATRQLSCRRLQHVARGHEELTLQHLYDFCQDHDSMRVGYIHTKGSLHQGHNDLWRRYMTAAATNEFCVQPPDAACNVCGLHFRPVWTPFFPGNFWTATCKYVKKLQPPKDYVIQMHSVAMRIRWRIGVGKLRSGVYAVEEDKLGIGRYSAEHWIGSHPSLVPCDVTDDLGVLHHRSERLSPSDYSFGMAPRGEVTAPWLYMSRRKQSFHELFGSTQTRFRELYLLGGQTFKWQLLYNETPPFDSWAWKWFPDGDLWRDATARYGIGAADALLRLAVAGA